MTRLGLLNHKDNLGGVTASPNLLDAAVVLAFIVLDLEVELPHVLLFYLGEEEAVLHLMARPKEHVVGVQDVVASRGVLLLSNKHA